MNPDGADLIYNKKIFLGGLSMDNIDIIDMMAKHTQDLRSSLTGDPSAATQAAWRLEDTRLQMLRDYYARQEDPDDFTFDFSSEVKRK